MTGLWNLTRRNIKLFFRDRGMFFTSLITPMILLVLYSTFLANVYESSFRASMPPGFETADAVIDAVVGGELVSSLLAVSCVTVAFCCNMLMVQDRVTGVRHDFVTSPVRRGTLAVSYYAATLVSTLIVCLAATAVSLIYLHAVGWYMSVSDVFLLILDVLLLVLFGTALSSIVNIPLRTQGQISAVGTVVSAGYGFVCGAYMPISSFSEGLQRVISFLPGTYGTSLLRNHVLRGVFAEMETTGFPPEVMTGIRDSIDCNLYFFGHSVPIGMMYLILGGSVILSVAVYVLICAARRNKF